MPLIELVICTFPRETLKDFAINCENKDFHYCFQKIFLKLKPGADLGSSICSIY